LSERTAGGTGRVDGVAPIAAYALIGDGGSVALVASDCDVDWLAAPTIADVPSLSALLDPAAGGRFSVRPDGPWTSSRRYLPDTNVLETTFTMATGTFVVLDAMTVPEDAPAACAELARRIVCTSGSVSLRWAVSVAFGLPATPASSELRRGTPVFVDGSRELGVFAWGAGEMVVSAHAVTGAARLRDGERALLAIVQASGSALPLPTRAEIERRLDHSIDWWRAWVARGRFPPRGRDAVVRSALALRLLLEPSTGALAAAPTTSLPERIGGTKNWDYRFAWVRDTAFALDALSRLGYSELVHLSFTWLVRAGRSESPRIPVLYRLDAMIPEDHETELDLPGYGGSRPVRVGNAAAGQLQLGVYGDFMETAHLYVRHGNTLDAGTREQLSAIADHVVGIWRDRDSGIWELRGDPEHYTMSKIGCWAALDRAVRLARLDELQVDRVPAWLRAMAEIEEFVETRCWSDSQQAYTLHAGDERLDAALLRAVPWGYFDGRTERLTGTVDAILRGLADGHLVYRYTGMQVEEGAFLACSFWLVGALLAIGRRPDAEKQFAAAVACGNSLGLLSEQIAPDGVLLGNFPQALSHLALIDAALRLERDDDAVGRRR
jgi:GH15 family glucan-1,4-alpha-glucosidase